MQLPELVQLNTPFILILLIAFAAATGSYYLYRRTVPEMNTLWRIILSVLRGVVLFLVLALFFKPTLHLEFKRSKPVRIAVFADLSQSMEVKDDGISRLQMERQVMRYMDSQQNAAHVCQWFGFNDRVFPLPEDSLTAAPRATNLETVLKKIEELEPDAAVIVSDGNYTEGARPDVGDFRFRTRVFTIGLGDTTLRPDVFIADVQFQPVAYQNKKQGIIVRVGNQSLTRPMDVRVRFEIDGVAAATKTVRIARSGAQQEVTFEYTPKTIGLHRLGFVVDQISSEQNLSNNRRVVVQRILKSKITIAVLSGQPDYESKFIKLLLNRHPDFECRLFTQDRHGRWIGHKTPPDFAAYDVLVLSDFPSSFTHAGEIQKLLAAIKTNRPGLIFRLGTQTDIAKLKSLLPYLPVERLPVKVKPRLTLEYLPAPIEREPLLQIFEQAETGVRFWQSLPPLSVPLERLQLVSGSQILVRGVTARGETPVLVLQDKKGKKSALLVGTGFWRWYFLLQEEKELAQGYPNLLRHLVRRLAQKQKLKPVVMDDLPDQRYAGQDVALKAHLFDPDFKPLVDGSVRFDVRWKGQEFSLEAKGDSSGVYYARFTPPGEGKFVVVATGMKNQTVLGNDRQEFEVIPFEKELLTTTQNKKLLVQLAEQTGGAYYLPAQMDSLQRLFETQPKEERVVRDVDLWYRPFLLLLILTAIVAEWIIRKIRGLA